MKRINRDRLLRRLSEMAAIGASPEGGVTRLALTDEDREGRRLFESWTDKLGLTTRVDRVGNMLCIRPGREDLAPVLMGSHLDSVIGGGRLDGPYGVLAALEALQTLAENGIITRRPLGVISFTNEEGVRYAPGMLGSHVACGAMSVEEARALRGVDGTSLGEELDRIGYAGDLDPTEIRPAAYLELHIEQGLILVEEQTAIGVVEGVVGITWLEITIEGAANHAGTTPTRQRRDAGLTAARIAAYLRTLANSLGEEMRATCGVMALEPNAVNVIPGRAVMRVDLRHPDAGILAEAEKRLAKYAARVAAREGVRIQSRLLERVPAARFDAGAVGAVGRAAADLGLSARPMVSGAGHDAQLMARVCPAAMIFVPSIGGISHSPYEFTPPEALEAGANVLLNVALDLAEREC